jgi:hypothetical protein
VTGEFAFLRQLVSVARKDLVEGSDCLQLLVSRPREGVNSFFEQCAEPSSGAVECADLTEQMFHRPVAGIAIHVPSDLVA